MDPDPVAGPDKTDGFLGELLVDPSVGRPVGLAVGGVEGKIMEQRPDRPVGEAVIEVLDFVARKENRMAGIFRQPIPDLPALRALGPREGDSRPADPGAGAGFGELGEAGRQSADARFEHQGIASSHRADGKTVGYRDQHCRRTEYKADSFSL